MPSKLIRLFHPVLEIGLKFEMISSLLISLVTLILKASIGIRCSIIFAPFSSGIGVSLYIISCMRSDRNLLILSSINCAEVNAVLSSEVSNGYFPAEFLS